MKVPIAITVNGVQHPSEVEPRLLLVHYLRDVLELTGTHVGCETGLCGACTVLLDGEAVKSCMVLAVQANGRSVDTVESLAKNGEMDAVQRGFWEEHGLQCGYCTPGFLMAAHDLLRHSPNPSDTEIRRALSGNLCRCTGYQTIVAAVLNAAKQMRARAGAQRPAKGGR
jgi:carbon-monoxide dehydrogenase small subunit